MLRYASNPPEADAPPSARTFLETDPVKILATAMIELAEQGRIVDAESLGAATDLTEPEIETHWRDARDLARRRQRGLEEAI